VAIFLTDRARDIRQRLWVLKITILPVNSLKMSTFNSKFSIFMKKNCRREKNFLKLITEKARCHSCLTQYVQRFFVFCFENDLRLPILPPLF